MKITTPWDSTVYGRCGCAWSLVLAIVRHAPVSFPRAVLVMTGDRDLIVPAWNAKRVAAAIPGSTFEMIPKCGHVPQEEKAEEVVQGIMGFLRNMQTR